MPYKIGLTVFFPTPLIFRYHLPLIGKPILYRTRIKALKFDLLIFYPRAVVKKDHFTFVELSKFRFLTNALQDPPLCSSTLLTAQCTLHSVSLKIHSCAGLVLCKRDFSLYSTCVKGNSFYVPETDIMYLTHCC